MRREKEELLEVIAQKAGCNYLSDLVLKPYRAAVRAVLQELEVVDYSLTEWQEAVRYLLDDDTICVDSREKSKKILLQKYEQK